MDQDPTRPATRAELFAHAGAALYGEPWQSPIAAALNLDLRRVQRIAAAARAGEDYQIADGVLRELAQLLVQRARSCRSTADAIAQRLAPAANDQAAEPPAGHHPTVVLHVDQAGAPSLHVCGDPVTVLWIDDTVPDDRVYRLAERCAPDLIAALVGDDTIGDLHDEKYPNLADAIAARGFRLKLVEKD